MSSSPYQCTTILLIVLSSCSLRQSSVDEIFEPPVAVAWIRIDFVDRQLEGRHSQLRLYRSTETVPSSFAVAGAAEIPGDITKPKVFAEKRQKNEDCTLT